MFHKYFYINYSALNGSFPVELYSNTSYFSSMLSCAPPRKKHNTPRLAPQVPPHLLWLSLFRRDNGTMSLNTSNLDAQIDRLREGGTLSEHEVKALCDKVSCLQGHSCAADTQSAEPIACEVYLSRSLNLLPKVFFPQSMFSHVEQSLFRSILYRQRKSFSKSRMSNRFVLP